MLWCWVGLWIASHSRLCINGPSEPGRLRDVCVCQWVKTPTCFGHSCLTLFRGPFSVLSAVTATLLVCIVRLFIWYVAVYYLQNNVCIRMIPWFLYQDVRSEAYDGKEYRLTYVCEWLMYLCVQTSTSGMTHIDNIQPHTK